MKTSKWLIAAILVGLVLGAAFGASLYLERRVINAVTGAVAARQDSSVGSVRFSLPGRMLEVDDLLLTLEGESGSVLKIQKARILLPWEMVLSPEKEGIRLAAESCTLQGLEFRTDAAVTTAAMERYVNVRTDVRLLRELRETAERTSESLITLAERSGWDLGESENLEFRAADLRLSFGRVVVAQASGLKVDAVEITDCKVTQEDGEPVAGFASCVLKGIAVPAKALYAAYADPLNGDAGETQRFGDLNGIQRALLSGPSPLVSQIMLKDMALYAFKDKNLAVTVASSEVDWTSNNPLHATSKLEKLHIPTEIIEGETGISLPKLPVLELNVANTVDGDNSGNLREHNVYEFRDVCRLEMRTHLVARNMGMPGMPISMFDYGDFTELSLAGFDAQLEDTGLTAYLLWNLEGPEATGEGLLELLPLVLRQGSDEQAYTLTLDAFSAFIRQPGRLAVSLTPEKPVRFFELPGLLLADPSAYLSIAATPGPTPVAELVKKLQ
jgi:hypothetical protein